MNEASSLNSALTLRIFTLFHLVALLETCTSLFWRTVLQPLTSVVISFLKYKNKSTDGTSYFFISDRTKGAIGFSSSFTSAVVFLECENKKAISISNKFPIGRFYLTNSGTKLKVKKKCCNIFSNKLI
jgi:hypothetical protein